MDSTIDKIFRLSIRIAKNNFFEVKYQNFGLIYKTEITEIIKNRSRLISSFVEVY